MTGRIIGKHPKHECDPPATMWNVELGAVWQCDCGRTWVAVQWAHGGYGPRNLPNTWRREFFWEKWRR